MPTAVLDLDLDHIPAELTGIHGYPRALIMTRFHGCPVGQVAVSLRDGGLAGDALRRAVFDALDWSFWERWLQAYLGWSPGDRITPSPVTATVAVCTRDRPEDLRRCLEALMRLPDDGQEVLVIDNAPATEATLRLVSEYPRARRSGAALRQFRDAGGAQPATRSWPLPTTMPVLTPDGCARSCVTSRMTWSWPRRA